MKRLVHVIEEPKHGRIILHTSYFTGKNAEKTCKKFISESIIPYVCIQSTQNMRNGTIEVRYYARCVMKI